MISCEQKLTRTNLKTWASFNIIILVMKLSALDSLLVVVVLSFAV